MSTMSASEARGARSSTGSSDTRRPCAGVAVDHDLEGARAVVVGQQPDRHEHVLEGLVRERRDRSAGCGRCRRGPARPQSRCSSLVICVPRALRRVEQHDLVVLDDEAGEERRVVGHQIRRVGNGSTCFSSVRATPLRSRHRLIVEEVIDHARRPAPSARGGPGGSRCGRCCRDRLGRVVVVARLRLSTGRRAWASKVQYGM